MLSLVTVSPVIAAFHKAKKINFQIKKPHLKKWFQLKTITNSVRPRLWKTRWEQIIGFIRPKNPTLFALRGPRLSGYRRWVSTVPGEHCQKIAVSNPTQAGQRFTWSKTWCDRQQLWEAVITGDTDTRHSIPIRGHG